MHSALFAYQDRTIARRVHQRLLQCGLPTDAVKLHAHESGPGEAIQSEVDELATGGFLSNFMSLFEGVFEWGGSPHDASAYAQTVRRGGAVISVESHSEDQRARADETVAADEPPAQRTGWAAAPAA